MNRAIKYVWNGYDLTVRVIFIIYGSGPVVTKYKPEELKFIKFDINERFGSNEIVLLAL